MAKLATLLRSRQKGWELDRYEFSPLWHKYSMFLKKKLPNLQGKKYFFAEVTLTGLVPFWGDLPTGEKAQCAPECSFRYDPERLDNFGRHRNTKACTKGMFKNCLHCGENLHNTVKLNRHLKRFECEKQFVCDLCNKMFRLPKELENHKIKEH